MRNAGPRESWLPGLIAFVVGCLLIASTSCSSLGDDTQACATGEGTETLEAAGLGIEDLTVAEGCTDVYRGLRSGETRTAVALGDEAAIMIALQSAHIDPAAGSSSPNEGKTAPPSFDVAASAWGTGWQAGERLTHNDTIEYRGRDWERYIAWGKQRWSDDYALMVILETGSM